MRRQAIIGALLIVGVGVVLGATVFRTDIAQATGLAQSVTVSNTASNPVPVREQNLDANGNIKVHEQGTANVNVTNSSLSVAAAAPISGGGGGSFVAVPDSPFPVSPTATASALSIHLSPGVNDVQLLAGGSRVALFWGPGSGGNADIVLALSRPVTFDQVACLGSPTDICTVSWIGNQP